MNPARKKPTPIAKPPESSRYELTTHDLKLIWGHVVVAATALVLLSIGSWLAGGLENSPKDTVWGGAIQAFLAVFILTLKRFLTDYVKK